MKKRRIIVMLIAFLALMPLIGSYIMGWDLFAIGIIGNTPNGGVASTLHTGDKVHLGTANDDVFIVLGQDSSGYIYFLKEYALGDAVGDPVNYNTALNNANAYNNEDNFGKVGTAHLSLSSNKVSLISKAELNAIPGIVSGNDITASVGIDNVKWWLKDANTTTNRASFVDGNNMAAVNEIKEGTSVIGYNDPSSGTCSTTTKDEIGVMPITKGEAPKTIKNQYISSAQLYFSYPNTSGMKFKGFLTGVCTNQDAGEQSLKETSSTYSYSMDYNGKRSWITPGGAVMPGIAMVEFSWRPYPVINSNGTYSVTNSSKTVSIQTGTCYQTYLDNGSAKIAGTQKLRSRKFPNSARSVSFSVSLSGTPTITNTYCPTVTNEAGSAMVRPYVKFKASDIIMRNHAKRAYSQASKLSSGAIPSSDNDGDYLTLQTPSLSVALDRSADGVIGDTYQIPKPTSGTTLKLPLSFGSSPIEGNRYVAAEAVDKDGNTVYGILDSVGPASTAEVELDYSNLLAPGDNSFTLTLFLEDSGIGNTSYRSEGKKITVYFKDPQYIKFADATPSFATYGERIEVWAELYDYATASDGSIYQSKSAIAFGVVPNSDGTYSARIVKQEYDFDTGKAYAIIEPLTGNGTFTLKINKDKDNFFFAAEQKTLDFRLEKRDLKIAPPIITTAVVGDRMSSLYPDVISGSLVNGDDIPEGLYPNLERTDPAFAIHPSDDGKFIHHPGTWGQHFPDMSDPAVLAEPEVADFLNKYNVDYEDYKDDPQYVFMVDPDGVLDSWIEIIPSTPNGNHNWYNTDIILRPSSEAKAFGFFEIALVENGVDGAFGSEVILNKDITSLRPTVKLKKQDLPDGTVGEISKEKQLSTRIKIDQTKPKLDNVTIPSGWASPSKAIDLQTSDETSGIDTVNVYYKNASGTNDPMTVMSTGGGTYRADVTKNGTYLIEVIDKAGNKLTSTRIINGVDTEASITATPAAAASSGGDYHDITITTVEPASGISYIDIYYREDGSAPYLKIGSLNPALSSQVYAAQMNGDYKFEMVAGSGKQYEAEVTIVDITQIIPVVKIDAVNMGTGGIYYPNTWINEDVQISLSNTNHKFTDPITYQYRKISDHSWTDVSGNTLEIQASAWLNEEYLFKAVSGDVESRPVSIIVKIDKEKPQPPVLDQKDDSEFFADTKITGHVLPKDSKIPQVWEYSLDDGMTWFQAYGDEFDLMGIGDHDILVRTKDEAGNISDEDSYTMHIKDKLTQEIEFVSTPASMTYGTCATVTAKLTSDVADQANTPLLFSIPASDAGKAYIKTQKYDPSTGAASADVCATSGDVYFDIEINKAGDAKAKPAAPKVKTIALVKVPVTVYPQIIYGKVVGDLMPTLVSDGNGLISGDLVPNAFTINLTPDASTADSLPFDTGNPTITHAGTWTMTYPANILTSSDPDIVDFLKKYDVTLEDYNTNTDYVFTVTDSGIPDGWVIVSPNANADGWNNTDVTLSLSSDAQAAGYTSLALIEHGAETLNGATVLLSNPTNGMYPVVILKKDDGTRSDYKTLRYVKIDKTPPTAVITIENEAVWTKTDKKVTIQVSDALSGVKDVKVTDSAGNDVTLTPESANMYSFMADLDTYQLTVTDIADNTNDFDITVDKIDKAAPTITATLGALSADESHHDVDVEATVGASGVGSFSVYYKEKASDAYPTAPSDTLNPAALTCVYQAQKNGFYLFEIVNGVGEKATAEVEVSDVVEVLPVVDIKAELDDGSHTPYVNGTWVNQDVIITLSNTNAAISEPITYEYRKVGDTNWTTLDNDNITIEESAWQNEDYEFRGVISTGAGGSSAINVRIDKVKPDIPTIDNADDFTADNAFAAPLTITGSVTAKDSGIGQTIWVSKDHGISDWTEMVGNQLMLTTPDAYELTFKTVDEAGNESDEFTLEDIIVNDGTPLITIKLNNNPLKNFVHKISFGYFFKDHVDVDIEVDWYGMANGDIYYILDDSENPTVPADDDARWTSGAHTSVDPDRKTMIYAKAVNSNGKIAKTSSTYFVIADQTPPEITFDKDYTNWISDNSLIASVSDNLSGVRNETIEAKIDHSNKGNVEAKGSDLHFTNLPDGSYKLQVSGEDNSGNEHSEIITAKIDTTAPEINGVKDKSIYHHYYLPRYIQVEDKHSGIAKAQITKNNGQAESITNEIKVKDIGVYVMETKDHAGNEQTLTFEIVALPDIATEIDCSEKSKQIIAQIEQEYEEAKDHMDATELANVEKWLSDARDIRNTCRIKVVYNEDKSAWVEGVGDVDFAIDVVLVVEDIATADLPKLPVQARMAYDVYLMQGDQEIEPDGMVKVHLPYSGTDKNPILYEINDAQKVKEISAKQSDSHLVFEADTLLKYAIAMKEDPSKPGTGETCTIKINQDSDGDGLPDLNIDIDKDGKADLNVDVDCDGIPDINIDTDGDGKPDFNVDSDGDGSADINIGTLPKPWKPNKCQTVNDIKYCTMGNLKPHINIDTDHDGRPDVNLDLDGDRLPDLNIDADGDLIPDVDIDSDGDGKADINIDLNGDGIADLNLVRLTKWKPDANYEVNGFRYDTMSGLKPEYNIDTDGDGKADENLVDNTDNRYNLSGSDGLSLMNKVKTGDYTRLFVWLLLFLLTILMNSYCFYRIMRQKKENRQS